MLRFTLAEKTIVRQNMAHAYTVGIGHIKPPDYIKNDPKNRPCRKNLAQINH